MEFYFVIFKHFFCRFLCTDLEGLLKYVEDYSPIYSPMEGRIKMVK